MAFPLEEGATAADGKNKAHKGRSSVQSAKPGESVSRLSLSSKLRPVLASACFEARLIKCADSDSGPRNFSNVTIWEAPGH